MPDPTTTALPAATFTPAARVAAAAELALKAEAHRRAADRCTCGQPDKHMRVAAELADIAAEWRRDAIAAAGGERSGS